MNRRRSVLVAAAFITLTLIVVAGGGAASAHWRVTGSGSGAGATGATVAATLTPGSVAADLYPGGNAGVTTTASNPNSAIVRVGGLALDTTQGSGGFAVDAAHAGCPASSFSFATQTNGGAGWTVPANGSLPISLASALSMTSTALNACQGVVVTVYLTTIP